MLTKTRLSGFMNRVYRSKGGLWIPLLDLFIPKHRNILFVLGRPEGKVLLAAANIVTNDGDVYYAQKAVGETATNAFTKLYLSTVNWDSTHPQKSSTSDNIASMISGTEKAPTSGYPKTADADADNTGAGTDVITWAFSYAKADFSDNDIDAGAISKTGVTSWGAGAGTDPLLTGFDIGTAFAKTSNDTLKVFVNHTANGV